MKSYLTNRLQCVQYNEQRSSLKSVKLGVPQGSILGPLLFLFYITDLPNISKKIKLMLYADDTAIFFESKQINELQQIIEEATPHICLWLQMNKLSLNTDKTVFQLYTNTAAENSLTVRLNNVEIKNENIVKYLGMYLDSNMNWSSHIDHLSVTLSRNIGIISRSRYFLNKQSLLLLYNALVLPYISYCCCVWGFTYVSYLNKIEILQKKVVRIIDNQPRYAHAAPIFKDLKILKVSDIAKLQITTIMHKTFRNELPNDINALFTLATAPSILTRNRRHFSEPFSTKLYRTRLPTWVGPRLWNSLVASDFNLVEVRATSKSVLKKIMKGKLILSYI